MKQFAVLLVFRLPAMLLSILLAGCVSFDPVPLAGGVKREKDLVYTPPGWPEELQADVYHRPGAAPAPAVLLVHGGSWKENGPKWSMTPIAKTLARRGYVAVNVQYRGTPDYCYPAPVEDLAEAIRWMRRNADRFGIDRERIGVFGYSAGGHLAALLSLKHGNPQRVAAIVVGGAPFDFQDFPAERPVPLFLGVPPDQVAQRFREISPVLDVTPSSPPIFLFHGSRDRIVDPEQAGRMQAAYRRQGFDPEVHLLAGRGHFGAFLFPGDTIDQAIDFLDANLRGRR